MVRPVCLPVWSDQYGQASIDRPEGSGQYGQASMLRPAWSCQSSCGSMASPASNWAVWWPVSGQYPAYEWWRVWAGLGRWPVAHRPWREEGGSEGLQWGAVRSWGSCEGAVRGGSEGRRGSAGRTEQMEDHSHKSPQV